MCKCEKDINEKLTERFVKASPEATNHDVALQGYAFAVTDGKMVSAPFMEYKTTATYPLKKGGTKEKSTRGNMMFNYCPFCGVSLAAAA